LNTVSLLVKGGHWTKRGRWLLAVDALARVSGAAIGSAVVFNESSVAIYLAVFSGMVIYLATSHILPEAHSRHPSRLTLLATIAGVLTMWLLVANLGMH
jgi:zinc transporter, ZIP family